MNLGWYRLLLVGISLGGVVATAQEVSLDTPSVESFTTRHPGSWRVSTDVVTQHPTFLWGERIQLAKPPVDDVDFESSGRQFIDESRDLFGVGSDELTFAGVVRLPLSKIGSTDKVAARFHQEIDGLPVLGANITLLFDATSRDLLAIDTTVVPSARDADVVPTASIEEVLPNVRRAFVDEFGVPFTQLDDATPTIVGPSAFFGAKSGLRTGTLSWILTLSAPGSFDRDGLPVEARVYVSAQGDHRVFKVEKTAHAIDGKVESFTNTTSQPTNPANQTVTPVPYVFIRSGSGNGPVVGLADGAGAFNLAASGPLDLAFEFEGPFCRTNHWNSPDHEVILPAITGSTLALLNGGKGEFTSAEATVYHHVMKFRDFIKAVDPLDYTMDIQVLAHVNKNDSPCSASFFQDSINFQRAAPGCFNTAYQDIVQHEEGHWANYKYTDGSTSKAFQEGNADAWAYYINDDPCITDFSNPATCLRTALQTTIKKCPNDGDENCHGGSPHLEGQVLASALWDVRERLNLKYGDAQGDVTANGLFLAWLRTFHDGSLLDVIEDHWLALDDDDGSISTLTPNFAAIHGGFKEYGFNGFEEVEIELIDAPLDNSSIGNLQPITITATLKPLIPPLTEANVYVQSGAGSYVAIPMTSTGVANEYAATIPGTNAPARVKWYVAAAGGTGHVNTLPNNAAYPHIFHVGNQVVLAEFDFEGPNDQGFVHVNLAGTSGDQWERGNPALSKSLSDPKSAYSGVNAWGTDLSALGLDGDYEPLSAGELRAPLMDFSNSSSVILQFRRWLSVEGYHDKAQLLVNNQVVYQNPQGYHELDGEWLLHDVDISAIAANNSAVEVKWRISSDLSLEFGGWTIDDVVFYRVDAQSGGYFSQYGAGCAGEAGVPLLSATGTPSAGQTVNIEVTKGKPFGSGLFVAGSSASVIPLIDTCSLLVGGPYPAGGAIFANLDAQGALVAPVVLPTNFQPTNLFLQFFGEDSAATNGVLSASNGLHAHLE